MHVGDIHSGSRLAAAPEFCRRLLPLFPVGTSRFNGDTHLYVTDHPLADPTSATGVIHHTQAVPNPARVVVKGSTNAPAEWLRLTIDPRKLQPFRWTNVAYCTDPLTSCQ
jgi:hypothetical protein